jgi:hypothetical protein
MVLEVCMRVGVLAYNQTINDTPSRYISKREAASYSEASYTRLSKRLIQEKFPRAIPSSTPLRFLKTKLKIVIPKLLPPQPPSNLNLFYPVKDYSSYAIYNMRRVWGNTSTIGNPIPY